MSDSICKPNFFIVGAPKSGTTSLHYYLSQHPDVHMSKNKEPCFLAPDFNSPFYPQTEEEYLLCFKGYSGQSRIGESTTSYLYSKKAAHAIHNYAPNAKIIAMLRNPVDLVISLHAQRLKEGSETLKRLENALEAEADRRQGRRIPIGFKYPNEYLLYREYGKYPEQLDRYFSVFGRENVLVIIFDDFKKDVEGEFVKICKFLDISTDFKPDFTIQNTTQTPRVIILHRIFKLVTPALVKIGQRFRSIIPSWFLKLLLQAYCSFREINMKTGKSFVCKETRNALASYYKKEIECLEKLLAKDLSSWRLNIKE